MRLAAPSEMPLAAVAAQTQRLAPGPATPSLELLKLRAEVAQLGNRKHELADARVESERLHGLLATRATNAPGDFSLPAGYIRKSDARLVGYTTPENTMQSLLWAVQNRDASGLLQAFDPENAKQLKERMQDPSSTDEVFKEFEVLPGMHVLGREAGADGAEVLTVEIMPGIESPVQLRFKPFEGQWKLVGGL